jgi:hypothetical protein
MRLQSSFKAVEDVPLMEGRDAELTRFVRSIVTGARDTWGDRIIAEGNGTFDPRMLYTETHYALTAVLLFVCDKRDHALLDLAEARLRLWATGTYPLTFFNAMAICLAAIVLRRSGTQHAGLQSILNDLVAKTREHRHVAYPQWCGNNAYLQQVAIDTVLLPVTRGDTVTADGVGLLMKEFRSFRTPEGFFFDLPRSGTLQERLCPPTYVMKMLFLLGITHELHESAECAALLRSGMAAARPLLTRDGTLSYFGRTDNSPFAAGLTIFNLRKAAQLSPEHAQAYDDAGLRAERFYRTFPRTTSGVLQANRFGDAASTAETWYSKDAYAYVAQYSLASCAYALLGIHWFPAQPKTDTARSDVPEREVAVSHDLGVVKVARPNGELVVRTGSEMTGWDRRYLGPTILRYRLGDSMLVGAISRTVSTDREAQADAPQNRMSRVFQLLQHRYRSGAEHLDGVSVGFLPVLRRGAVDFVPYTPLFVDATPGRVKTRHHMQRVNARGVHPCLAEALQLLRGKVPGLQPKRYIRPMMEPEPRIELSRDIRLMPTSCRIEDQITGAIGRRELIFSVRRLPGTRIQVEGLLKLRSFTGWGSDGRQTMDVYGTPTSGAEIRYACEIEEA